MSSKAQSAVSPLTLLNARGIRETSRNLLDQPQLTILSGQGP